MIVVICYRLEYEARNKKKQEKEVRYINQSESQASK